MDQSHSPESANQTINPASNRPAELAALAKLFLKLGTIGFGGPAAHIALFEDEVVRRRRWLTRDEFLDLLGAVNLIPGPNSTEMAIHIGHRRAGWPGLLVAGTCFILPATLIVAAIAWSYVRFGALPQVEGLFYGVKPVIIAVVLQALWGLGRSALKSTSLVWLALAAAALSFAGVNELLVLFGSGLWVALGRVANRPPAAGGPVSLPGLGFALPLAVTTGGVAVAKLSFGLWPMFLFFLKVGSVLFGSGYVLLAFLRADLVERWQWLSEAQLLDAIAIGQFTPGPLFTTATFIGYLLGGAPGAIVATIGIFLPAFVFVAISGPLIPRLRRSPVAGAVLDGVNVGSLALMAVVTLHLGVAALVDWPTIGLAVAAAILLIHFRINSAWLVLGGAVAGTLIQGF
ncbi:MAG: chromate efflux transporter [Verrucomicrobia bacterium]|nr:chromate efflux transporter [Verrucomicrobiota bacterium]